MRRAGRILDAVDGYLARCYGVLTWKDVWLVVLTAAFAGCLVYTTPFAVVLREDAYNFTVKGMEIALGDFSLDRPQAIGWPALLGLVYWIMSADNVFEAMYLSRWTSIICTALAAFALGKTCVAMFPGGAKKGLAVTIVLAMAFNSLMFSMARSAMSEALFLLCVVGVVYFTVRALKHTEPGLRLLAIAALLAAVSYYVRPNGLFVFAALLPAIVFHSWGRPRAMLTAVGAATSVFVAAVVPYLYARFAAFGSPFDYGPNSKYFVDDYNEVWADNISSPSLLEFLGSHDPAELYDRFVTRGLLAVLGDTHRLILEFPWPALAVAGTLAIVLLKKRSAYIVPFVLAVSIGGLSLVFAIFGTLRHLFYFLPLLLLCGGGAFFVLDRFRVPGQSIAATVLALTVVLDTPAVVWMGPEQRQIPQVQDHWAVWTANNAEGTVAIVEGGDFVKMSQHYQATGWRIPRRFADVEPKIDLWRPGIYENLDEALAEFKEKGVTYLITDNESMKRRPYLRYVSHPRWRRNFVHLGYYPFGSKGSKIPRVNIYRVVY